MRESMRSIRAYFWIVAVIGLFQLLNLAKTISEAKAKGVAISPLVGLIALLQLAQTGGLGYLGATLPTTLATAPKRAEMVLFACLGCSAGCFGIAALFGEYAIFTMVASVAITLYLRANCNRLAGELGSQPPPDTPARAVTGPFDPP